MTELSIGTRIRHPRYGEGIISKDKITSYEIFFEKGGKVELTKNNADIEVLNEAIGGPKNSLALNEIEKVLEYVLDKHAMLQEVVPMGEKWTGGTLILQPANPNLQAKEVPVETFFHKIVMVRDRLRVLEQNINSHEKLSDEEKVDLQQYITRAYGSLTTFNVLFSEKEHYFTGQKTK